MKKYIMTLVIALGFGMSVSAQSDGFFSSNYEEYREGLEEVGHSQMPAMIGHGYTMDQNAESAPIGSGLLLLAGMGLLYASRKR